MLKLFIISSIATLYLVLADVENDILNNDLVFLSDNGNNETEHDVVVTPSDYPYVHRDVGEKKVVNIVVNPIIHNVAQSFGGGQTEPPRTLDTTTAPTVTTTSPPDQLLADVIRVFFRKTRFLTRFMLNGVRTLVQASVRFIICTFIPLCGIFGGRSDQVDFNSTVTTEGLARGLDLISGIIEEYHSLRNRNLL